MKSKKYQQHSMGVLFLYLLIFHGMFFQGAYYITGLLTLNIGFLVYILFTKRKFKLDLPLVLFLGIFILAIFSNLFFSINVDIGIIELAKYALFPLSYMIFTSYEDKNNIEELFYRSFIMLMIFGILAWLGLSVMPGMVTEKSNRLQSFLQYANTTALFMGIGLLLSIDRTVKYKKKRYLFLGILFAFSLFLTQSRTTFVLFIFIVGLYVFGFLKNKQKWIFVSGIGLSFVAMLIGGARITKIALTEPTLIERLITYYDGVFILLKKPFGLGLGNWQFMQFQYQSAPYQVRYVHNVFIQMALDGGLLISLLFVALLVFYFLKNYKTKDVHFYIFLLIVLQSFFEISFNYGIVIIYFTFLLTCLKQPEYLIKQFKRPLRVPSQMKYILVIPLIILTMFLIGANNIGKGDRNKYKDPEMAYYYYTKAEKINPLHTELYFKKAQLQKNPKKALELLERGFEKNPYDFQILLSLAEGYLYSGEIEKASFYGEKLLDIFPYHKKHQQLNYKILEEAYNKKELIEKLNARILEQDKSINSLYKYIDPKMDY